jgi:hypothetical protein
MKLFLVLLVAGVASRYDPGVFEMVARNRGLSEWDGGHIAVLDGDLVGETVIVCDSDDVCWWAQVTDCAGIADGGYAWMVRNGIAGELDYHRGLYRSGTEISVYNPRYGYVFE